MRRKATEGDCLRVLDDLAREVLYGVQPTDAELDRLLADLPRKSDADLRAAAKFFDLDLVSIEQHAARLEFSDGMPRVTANRLALTYELQETIPGLSDAMCKWFAQHSATIVNYARAHGLSRYELAVGVCGYLARNFGQKETAAVIERVK